jgi:hypothetical protein
MNYKRLGVSVRKPMAAFMIAAIFLFLTAYGLFSIKKHIRFQLE